MFENIWNSRYFHIPDHQSFAGSVIQGEICVFESLLKWSECFDILYLLHIILFNLLYLLHIILFNLLYLLRMFVFNLFRSNTVENPVKKRGF